MSFGGEKSIGIREWNWGGEHTLKTSKRVGEHLKGTKHAILDECSDCILSHTITWALTECWDIRNFSALQNSNV